MAESWASADAFRRYQPKAASDETAEATIREALERATDIARGVLRNMTGDMQLEFAGYTTDTKRVYGSGTQFLSLPAHDIGTVTTVVYTSSGASLAGYWEEQDDGSLLAVETATGAVSYWRPGTPYTITADWGYGEPPPAVEEVVVELAVNIWQSKSAGKFSRVVGVQGGGAVGYEGALTPQQRMALENVARSLSEVVI